MTKKRVLIVDDSATVRQQVSAVLQLGGFDAVEAVDGADGLALLVSDATIAMVICDVNMPRMNGLDMIEQAGQKLRLGCPPVVMLTTEGQPALMQRAKKAGAKGWIVKPFKAHLLLAAVRKLTA